jgi:hypothetical protein
MLYFLLLFQPSAPLDAAVKLWLYLERVWNWREYGQLFSLIMIIPRLQPVGQ